MLFLFQKINKNRILKNMYNQKIAWKGIFNQKENQDKNAKTEKLKNIKIKKLNKFQNIKKINKNQNIKNK